MSPYIDVAQMSMMLVTLIYAHHFYLYNLAEATSLIHAHSLPTNMD